MRAGLPPPPPPRVSEKRASWSLSFIFSQTPFELAPKKKKDCLILLRPCSCLCTLDCAEVVMFVSILMMWSQYVFLEGNLQSLLNMDSPWKYWIQYCHGGYMTLRIWQNPEAHNTESEPSCKLWMWLITYQYWFISYQQMYRTNARC